MQNPQDKKLRDVLTNKMEGSSGMIKGHRRQVPHFEGLNAELFSSSYRKRGAKGHLRRKKELCTHQIICSERSGKDPSSADLARQTVLIVGGITKLESFYRKTIEEQGGMFDYHSGHMKGGRTRLESKIRRAHLVLCPVDCNSHNACLMAKKLGRKYERPVYMLAKSSLKSISQALCDYQNRISV